VDQTTPIHIMVNDGHGRFTNQTAGRPLRVHELG